MYYYCLRQVACEWIQAMKESPNFSSRRSFLRAGSVCLALPAFESLYGVGESRPKAKRFLCVAPTYGMNPGGFFPEQTGADYVMPRLLKPLERHRRDLTIFSNLDPYWLHIWPIWAYMDPCFTHMGPIWTHMDPFGPIWTHIMVLQLPMRCDVDILTHPWRCDTMRWEFTPIKHMMRCDVGPPS